MAGKTTYYERLQVVLGLASNRRVQSLDDLQQSIVRRSPPNFVYHRWDPEQDDVVPKCSDAAVRKTLGLACDLGLLDKSGTLTKAGKEAADKKRYDVVLRRRVSAYLEEEGVSVESVKKACSSMLNGSRLVLPTAVALYEVVCASEDSELPPVKFGVLLRLLAECGGIELSRRHIFLPT